MSSSCRDKVSNWPISLKLICIIGCLGLCYLVFRASPRGDDTPIPTTVSLDILNKSDESSAFRECKSVTQWGHCECPGNYTYVKSTNSCLYDCEFCSQKCIFQSTGFKCDCVAGYYLLPDQRRCKAHDDESGYLLLSINNKFEHVPINALDSYNKSAYKDFPEITVHEMDFLYSTNTLYFSLNNNAKNFNYTVYKVNINDPDVKNKERVLEQTSFFVVDWIYNNIYWTCSDDTVIKISNLNATWSKTLVNVSEHEEKYVYSMAVDPVERFLFWTQGQDIYSEPENPSNCTLVRSGLDGLNAKVIVHEVGIVKALTLDLPKQRVYVVEKNIFDRTKFGWSMCFYLSTILK